MDDHTDSVVLRDGRIGQNSAYRLTHHRPLRFHLFTGGWSGQLSMCLARQEAGSGAIDLN